MTASRSGLKTRIITAAVGLPLLLTAMWLAPPAAFWWLVALLAAGGAREWCRLAGIGRADVGWTAALAMLLLVGLGVARIGPQHLPAVGALAALLWVFNLAWLGRRRMLAEPTSLAMIVKLGVGLAVLVLGSAALGGLFGATDGFYRLLLFLLVIWAADVGAYAAGRAFGRRKLAPSISPGKTWEGVIGGQVLVALVVAALAAFDYPLARPLAPLILWAALAAAVSVVGDLFVSLLKRQRGIKDTGTLFPGHGGVLDRFDSALAAAPVFAWGLSLIR